MVIIFVVASTTKIQKWKQITTNIRCLSRWRMLLPVRQRYKNESKSQLVECAENTVVGCCQYDKDTKMKANHNALLRWRLTVTVVASTTKIQKWKQITTMLLEWSEWMWLLPVRQRYKNESKSQRYWRYCRWYWCCCQYDKDTKMKANHNTFPLREILRLVVASTTKIQKWKQITTKSAEESEQWSLLPVRQRYKNESKSQPFLSFSSCVLCCCQYDKDTKMKANHNVGGGGGRVASLLPVRQRYKNESKSQHMPKRSRPPAGCCQYDKDTKMKANHNKKSVRPKAWKVVASTTKIQKWKQITTIDSLFIRTSFISLLISYNQFQSENFKQGFNSLYCHAPAFLNISKPLIRQSRLLSQFVSWHPDFFSFCQYGICYFLIQFHATNVRKLFHISKLFGVFYSAFEFLKIFNICAVVASTTKIQKWKQITTRTTPIPMNPVVVASTTKIQKRKQITTNCWLICYHDLLLPIR